jgi:hypothetical protein
MIPAILSDSKGFFAIRQSPSQCLREIAATLDDRRAERMEADTSLFDIVDGMLTAAEINLRGDECVLLLVFWFCVLFFRRKKNK